MKIMSNDSSARPHTIKSINNHNISDALKRRAQSVINNKFIDAETRAIIRYGLETNDPWLGDLVRRAAAGETIIDSLSVPPTSEEKIEALAEIICRTRCWS
jgi:MoxR-like ATPase